MTPRLILLLAIAALAGCKETPREKSLVGDFAVPGAYALAGDTITVWKRLPQPGGGWRFQSYSITSGGTVEYLEESERLEAPANPEEAQDLPQMRQGFTLPQSDFEAIRGQVALLRPVELGPDDPVGGYAGEAYPIGCEAGDPTSREAGINFLNHANWGGFVLPAGCKSPAGDKAAAIVTQVFGRLERARGSR